MVLARKCCPILVDLGKVSRGAESDANVQVICESNKAMFLYGFFCGFYTYMYMCVFV